MILIHPELEMNGLRMTFSGQVRRGDLAREMEELAEALSRLEADFCVFTDLCELERMDAACVMEVQEMMKAFAGAGVGEVVRVIPDPRQDIGFAIMSAFHYPASVRIVTYRDRSEAERHCARRKAARAKQNGP